VACAAGLAALDILQKEDVPGRVKAWRHFEQAVHSLKGAKHVADIRNYGLAAGFTIAALPGEPAPAVRIAMACWKKGFYVRYGGDTIQLAPPFISNRDRAPGQRWAMRWPRRRELTSQAICYHKNS
jgi:beta-alanine--pyruvate transaminase